MSLLRARVRPQADRAPDVELTARVPLVASLPVPIQRKQRGGFAWGGPLKRRRAIATIQLAIGRQVIRVGEASAPVVCAGRIMNDEV